MMTDLSLDALKARYPSLYAPSQGYVFVSTYGRSGSTLMMKLLNAIPDACIRGENNNALAAIFRSVRQIHAEANFSDRRREAKKNPQDITPHFARILGTPDDPWYGAENVDPEAYIRSLLDVFVRCVLNPPQGVGLLGFKDIHFYESKQFFEIQMNYMLQYFPNCKIIFQTRDIEQVVVSGWWKARNREAVLAMLRDADEMFSTYCRAHPDSCIMFDYSMFSKGYEGVAPLLEFLGARLNNEAVDRVLSKRLTHLAG